MACKRSLLCSPRLTKSRSLSSLPNRPRCAIYDLNYRYGDSLIRGGLDNVEKKYVEKMAHIEFKSQNRTPERDSLSSALSHSYSTASLPPRPETPSSTLRRSKSVVRPVSVVDVAPGEFELIQIENFFFEKPLLRYKNYTLPMVKHFKTLKS